MSVQATFSATLVDEWVHLGVTDAVICPGSRSTPLAVPLAERLRAHVRLDERSAAFFALGLALASGRPTVVCVTSGTAAAELHAAVVEAHHAWVPLIVCTADRPPELHETGAPQTIDQVGIFTTATRWAVSPGVPTEGQERTWRPLAARAFAESTRGPHGPGPVHLNLAFREPLTGEAGELPARAAPPRSDMAARLREAPPGEPLEGRGLVIVGGQSPTPPDPALVHALGEQLRWPVLADPRSRSPYPRHHRGRRRHRAGRRPPPRDRRTARVALAFAGGRRVRGLGGVGRGPRRRGGSVMAMGGPQPGGHRVRARRYRRLAAASAIAGAAPCDSDWLDSWRAREDTAQAAIEQALGHELNEPQVARAVYAHAARHDETVVAAASMPIRDLEWFAATETAPPRVLANRGVNGIDGVVSTALGVATSEAQVASGHRTIGLLGDLAFLHDVSGLVNLPDAVPCTLVVLDNGGGGIFSFLPQAGALQPDVFERLFGTPPSSDIGAVARGFGLPVREVTSLDQLEPALAGSGPALVRVMVPGRAENVALHDAINQAVRLALT